MKTAVFLLIVTALCGAAEPGSAKSPERGAMIGDIPREHNWGGMWLHNSEGKRILHLAPSDRRVSYKGLVRFLRKSEDPGIRASAARWLGSLGAFAAPALPDLRESLQDPDETVRTAATKAIARISERSEDKE